MYRLFALMVLASMALMPRVEAASRITSESIVCGTRADINAALSKVYGEVEIAGGIMRGGTLTQIHANLETGTWSIVQATSMKEFCVVAVGENLRIGIETAQPFVGTSDEGALMTTAVTPSDSWTITFVSGAERTTMVGEAWHCRDLRNASGI